MSELGDSLERMSFVQLLLLFAFVTSYVLALGGMLGAPARIKAGLLALALAAAFTAMTDPWVHGALLMVFVVAGLGLFVLASWLLVWLIGARHARQPLVQAMGGEATSPGTSRMPQGEGAVQDASPTGRVRASRV
jgi:hypothetical protein